MTKKIAWNIFKNTGNIEAFLEFKNISEREFSSDLKNEVSSFENISLIGARDENSKNKWSSNSGKNHSRF